MGPASLPSEVINNRALGGRFNVFCKSVNPGKRRRLPTPLFFAFRSGRLMLGKSAFTFLRVLPSPPPPPSPSSTTIWISSKTNHLWNGGIEVEQYFKLDTLEKHYFRLSSIKLVRLQSSFIPWEADFEIKYESRCRRFWRRDVCRLPPNEGRNWFDEKKFQKFLSMQRRRRWRRRRTGWRSDFLCPLRERKEEREKAIKEKEIESYKQKGQNEFETSGETGDSVTRWLDLFSIFFAIYNN